MANAIRFADLECLLLRLGYTPGKTTGAQKLFEYPAYDALVVLPPYRPEETVHPLHVMAIRKLSDERGIIDADSFDRLLENVTEATDGIPPEPVVTVSH